MDIIKITESVLLFTETVKHEKNSTSCQLQAGNTTILSEMSDSLFKGF